MASQHTVSIGDGFTVSVMVVFTGVKAQPSLIVTVYVKLPVVEGLIVMLCPLPLGFQVYVYGNSPPFADALKTILVPWHAGIGEAEIEGADNAG